MIYINKKPDVSMRNVFGGVVLCKPQTDGVCSSMQSTSEMWNLPPNPPKKKDFHKIREK